MLHKLGKRRFKLDPAPAFTKNNVGRLYRLQQQLIGKFSPSCLTNKARADNFYYGSLLSICFLALCVCACATYCHSPSSSSTLLTPRSATACSRREWKHVCFLACCARAAACTVRPSNAPTSSLAPSFFLLHVSSPSKRQFFFCVRQRFGARVVF